MKRLSLLDKIRFGARRITHLFDNRPFVVSLEVTLSCNCSCLHCGLGGVINNEKQIGPEDYAQIVKSLKPLILQISGGEPLLRQDIVEIVKATKQFGGLPYTILVTNGALLNEELYLRLKAAHLNQLSISLDFPDERHDDFRRHRGLFNHLEKTVPKLTKYGFKDIILNTAITRANFRDIVSVAKKAKEWGALISYSAYTVLRTGNREYAFEDEEDLRVLREKIQELIEFKRETKCIVNSEKVLLKTLQFLEHGYMPNCRAGLRFVIVMPDGSLVPCSMKRYKFSNLKELRKKLSQQKFLNGCGGCFVSIRCYSERSIWEELKEIPQYIKIVSGSLL